jgi:FkbM family methyltransferase
MKLPGLLISAIKWLVDLNEMIFFERRLRAFYRNEAKGTLNTVIDVGANKGQSIDFFLALNANCKIYAIEANPKLAELLRIRYSQHQNVTIFEVGISDKEGTHTFFENVFDYTSSFEKLNYDSKYLHKKAAMLGVSTETIISDQYELETMTLSTFITTHGLVNVDLIKIDTEGHEYSCLQGLFDGKTLPRYIQMEGHHDDMYQTKVDHDGIKTLLSSNGFLECSRIKHGFGQIDEIVFQRQEHGA